MESESPLDPRIGRSGLIICDGACGMCSVLIAERERFFQRHGFSIAPFQESWTHDMTGLTQETLSQAIHVITPDRRIYRGIELVRYLCSRVWWLVPFAVLLSIPGVKHLGAAAYGYIARRRSAISRACGLDARARLSSEKRLGS